MNLAATIRLHGGGPGSGCNGPNCGRPASSDATVVLVHGENPAGYKGEDQHGIYLKDASGKIIGEMGLVERYGTQLKVDMAEIPEEGNRGKGYGKLMYQKAVEFARERGLKLVSGNVPSEDAVRVWKSFGAKERPEGEYGPRFQISAGGAGSGCDPGVAKQHGTQCGRPAGEGQAFVSPSTEEGLHFEDAVKRIDSPEQKKFIDFENDVLTQVAGGGEATSTVGEWADGAENSTIMQAKNVDADSMRYITAMVARERQQKQAISFLHDDNGPDAVHTIKIKGDVNDVRKTLTSIGIEYRTLVMTKDGVEVHIYDPGTVMDQQAKQVAQKYGTQVETAFGHGEFIPPEASTREYAVDYYDTVIAGWQAAHPERSYVRSQNIAGSRDRLRRGIGASREIAQKSLTMQDTLLTVPVNTRSRRGSSIRSGYKLGL